MSNFAQKHTRITNFYLFTGGNPNMTTELLQHSRWKKAVLIVPLLASEFTDPENRQIFKEILRQLGEASYLSNIIFGLDQADFREVRELVGLIRDHGVKNALIQHNDGPGFSGIYERLSDAGFRLDVRGKGRNMFLSFGIALALGAHSIGLIDADMRSFDCDQLNRLFYPVQALDYHFCKAFYARLRGRQMYGRVKRLLLDPVLLALKRKFTDTKEEKILRLVDFLLQFNYQLSGEVVFDNRLLKRMHFAMNWGVEIFTLIEIYRKATNVAQVEISQEPFDHKHQPVSEEDPQRGLHKMAIDIVSTLLNTLVIEEGLEITDHFIRDLAVTYLNVADSLIKMYSDNAVFSGLDHDTNAEEKMVHGVFKNAILYAGDLLLAPYQTAERFSCFVSNNAAFRPYLDSGLLDVIAQTSRQNRDQIFEVPQTVSWERVLRKLPHILPEIIDVLEAEKRLYLN